MPIAWNRKAAVTEFIAHAVTQNNGNRRRARGEIRDRHTDHRVGDLIPGTGPKGSMISDEGKGNEDVEEKAEHEQIIEVLKQVEAGRTAAEMAREVGVSKHTIYAWKAQYGGMEVNEAEELRALREENHRLKKLVADLSLDKDMLKSLIQKNGYSSRV